MRSFRLTRASGSPRLDSWCRTLRPMGVRTVNTCERRNQNGGVRSRSGTPRLGPAPDPYPYRTAACGDPMTIRGRSRHPSCRRPRPGHRPPGAAMGFGTRSNEAARCSDRAQRHTPGSAGPGSRPLRPHVVRVVPAQPRRDHVPAVLPGEPVDADPGADRKLESGCIRLEVVGHLVLRGVRPSRRREGPTGQPVIASGREYPQRVPSLAPGVADSLAGVQDHHGPLLRR
jgi:hypothetical protein